MTDQEATELVEMAARPLTSEERLLRMEDSVRLAREMGDARLAGQLAAELQIARVTKQLPKDWR